MCRTSRAQFPCITPKNTSLKNRGLYRVVIRQCGPNRAERVRVVSSRGAAKSKPIATAAASANTFSTDPDEEIARARMLVSGFLEEVSNLARAVQFTSAASAAIPTPSARHPDE